MACDKQQSSDSGWENPFRPGGDLSREADEIVNMIKGGKPITPTEALHLGNGVTPTEDKSNKVTTVNLTTCSVTEPMANGNNLLTLQSIVKIAEDNVVSDTQAQVAKKVIPGPALASHVVIGEKEDKKNSCCVIQ